MHHTGILVLSIRGYSSDFNINRILMSSRTRKLGDLQNRKLACREREGESGVGRRRRLSEIGNCARRRITRSSLLPSLRKSPLLGRSLQVLSSPLRLSVSRTCTPHRFLRSVYWLWLGTLFAKFVSLVDAKSAGWIVCFSIA